MNGKELNLDPECRKFHNDFENLWIPKCFQLSMNHRSNKKYEESKCQSKTKLMQEFSVNLAFIISFLFIKIKSSI